MRANKHAERLEEGSGLIDIAALADMKSEKRLAPIDPLKTPAWGGGPARTRDHRLLIAILGGICLASVGVVGLALWVKVERAGSAGVLERAAGAGLAAGEGREPSASPAPAGVPEVLAAMPHEPEPTSPIPAATAVGANRPEGEALADRKADTKPEPEREAKTATTDQAEPRRQARRDDRRSRRPERAARLPAKPTRDQVLRAMRGIQSRVKRCAQGERGVVTLDLRVHGPRGRVSSAEVSGITGPAKRCIASAVRGARFPRFADERFAIRYPVKL